MVAIFQIRIRIFRKMTKHIPVPKTFIILHISTKEVVKKYVNSDKKNLNLTVISL